MDIFNNKKIIELEPKNIIKEISPLDTMFDPNNKDHYMHVAYSALQNIKVALLLANKAEVNQILDFGCGFGRVLRILKAAFPLAKLTACDLARDAVDFCAKTFNSVPVYSAEDPHQIALKDTYDMIWVGSMFTHFHSYKWKTFLQLMNSVLSPGGVLIFSAHGRHSIERIKNGRTYGLDENKLPMLLDEYERNGFGYLDYPHVNGFGVSVSTAAWVCAQINSFPELRLLAYTEQAWDNHHDIVSCVRVVDSI